MKFETVVLCLNLIRLYIPCFHLQYVQFWQQIKCTYTYDVAIITSLLKLNTSLYYRFSLPYFSHQFARDMQGHVSHGKKPKVLAPLKIFKP